MIRQFLNFILLFFITLVVIKLGRLLGLDRFATRKLTPPQKRAGWKAMGAAGLISAPIFTWFSWNVVHRTLPRPGIAFAIFWAYILLIYTPIFLLVRKRILKSEGLLAAGPK